jgi:uncharacterized protein (TIGR00251 family)
LRSSSVDSSDNLAWRRVGADGSITLEVHVQPGAKRNAVAGVHGECLKIRLAAPAIEGRANAALIAFLADAFRVPRRSVSILRGEGARHKTVRIASPAVRPDLEWASL